ncbi:MAG TPA: GH92 family glycosyl hydrolase, partial [Puia sp.]|nr:GH92 family glycosyl hydrolase [Puia sp.]
SPWQRRMADEPASPGFDDHAWLASEWTLQMGADGDGGADAWYRTAVRIDSGGEYTLQAVGGDRATVFVDGVVAASGNLHEGSFRLALTKGSHTIAVFTAHDGRDKLAGFLGSMMDVDPKGLAGEMRLEKGAPTLQRLAGWRFLPAAAPLPDGAPGGVGVSGAAGAAALILPTGKETGWRDYTIGDDAFGKREGFGWFRVVLPEPPAGAGSGVLDFRSTDENATVFLNGRRLLRHEGWNLPFRVNLDGLDTMRRPLVLTVFIENYSNEGGIDRPVQVHYFSESREIKGWRMHGGIGEPGMIANWSAMEGRPVMEDRAAMEDRSAMETGRPGAPCYYRTEFRVPPYEARGEHPIWRVHIDGLGHGSVWVNGHNLGRYPEKTPAPGEYIPECWLKDGVNELVIYDEDGRRPDSVTVRRERAAGRRLTWYSAGKEVADYVDPMIGTAKSAVPTKWGNEGGTYPGAVAPWGFVQMTPETRVDGGYDHADAAIGWFSCIGHMSGYPGGSAGRGKIMPVVEAAGSMPENRQGPAPRAFLHTDEVASPGYYRVLFRDNNTLVETTASERVGWMRCSFPRGVLPRVYIAGLDGIAALHFDRPVVREEKTGGGRVLTFVAARDSATVVEIAVAVSMVSIANAEGNWRAAGEKHRFDEVARQTREKWRKVLSVVDVEDGKEEDKIIFYTALYHALLFPWIISDADGQYRGADRQIHRVSGREAYGGFSPWDSFRSQQPLLTLLFPGRERDIILSMLDVYRQTGYLPSEPMTGNHGVPIIVDAYRKGIRGFDPMEAYAAMRKGIVDKPYRPADREAYRRLGYLPLSYPESVTRTVEYAYDDWVLSQFAKEVLHRDGDADDLIKGSYGYRNVFDVDSLFFLPREGGRFLRRPGTSGYKEGDQWAYTYFDLQYPVDLVNLLGGDREFVRRLDGALANGDIVFDNETVFHVPYLFQYAGASGKTREWVRAFRDGRFSATPGGLPGNDDLGAFSSWYVFSAMGFYPLCPGRPEYVTGTPLF